MLAIGALRRFAERNVRVPQDLSVVGCDDTFGSDFCNPPLTTLTAPTEQGGRVATDLLLSAIQRRSSVPDGVEPDETEREHDHERLVSYLTMRSSTGPAPKTS
jgi:LacI family repressor for deo operon, udp, cdd, tsx, nupC, and nupG